MPGYPTSNHLIWDKPSEEPASAASALPWVTGHVHTGYTAGNHSYFCEWALDVLEQETLDVLTGRILTGLHHCRLRNNTLYVINVCHQETLYTMSTKKPLFHDVTCLWSL